jgi:uncharacterized protein
MIHAYQFENKNILVDVESGAVLSVDELFYRLATLPSPQTNYPTLFALYPEEEVREALDEFNELVKRQILGGPPRHFLPREEEIPIKAMCLHVAHHCNLSCAYCFASQGDFRGARELMSEEVGKKAIDFLIQRSGKRRNLEVDFFGGEPLLNLPLVKTLVTYARGKEEKYGKRFRFTLTTNAMLLDEKTQDYLNDTMDNVVLSIDGTEETNDALRRTWADEGSYQTILPKIQSFVKKRGDRSHYIRGTFTRFQPRFVREILHLHEMGLKNLSMEPVVGESSMGFSLTEEHLPILLEEYETLARDMASRRHDPDKYHFFHFEMDLSRGPCSTKRTRGCGAGSEYIAVTPSGDIYPCHQFVGQEEFLLGTLGKGIYNKELRQTFSTLSLFDKAACVSCWAKYYCSGGCHAHAQHENGTMTEPHALSCELERKRVEMALYLAVIRKEDSHDLQI